jgi:hypothetical protein
MKKAKANVLEVPEQPGKSQERLMAEVAFMPASLNTVTTREFVSTFGELSLNDCFAVMREKVAKAKRGELGELEAMMAAQVYTLNAMFNSMAQRAQKNMGEYLGAFETYMRLALKAQAQSAKTVEMLAAIKNPPAVAFVKQANIGNAVQVNNGQEQTRARGRTEKPEPTNELLEARDGERLDTGAASTASGTDSDMATVGAFNRPGQ